MPTISPGAKSSEHGQLQQLERAAFILGTILTPFAGLRLSFPRGVADAPWNSQQNSAVITSIYNHQEKTKLQGGRLYSRNRWCLST